MLTSYSRGQYLKNVVQKKPRPNSYSYIPKLKRPNDDVDDFIDVAQAQNEVGVEKVGANNLKPQGELKVLA